LGRELARFTRPIVFDGAPNHVKCRCNATGRIKAPDDACPAACSGQAPVDVDPPGYVTVRNNKSSSGCKKGCKSFYILFLDAKGRTPDSFLIANQAFSKAKRRSR